MTFFVMFLFPGGHVLAWPTLSKATYLNRCFLRHSDVLRGGSPPLPTSRAAFRRVKSRPNYGLMLTAGTGQRIWTLIVATLASEQQARRLARHIICRVMAVSEIFADYVRPAKARQS